LLNISSGNPTS